jgi:hypothetical protein
MFVAFKSGKFPAMGVKVGKGFVGFGGGGDQFGGVGMAGGLKQAVGGADSTTCPACMTTMRSQYSEARARSWVISMRGHLLLGGQVFDQVHHRGLGGDVQARGGFVGNQ